MSLDLDKLNKFLIDSNNAGFTSGESKKWIKEKDGSTTIPFEKGKWRSDDNFFGGEPYGGRIIVFYKEKPVWMMVYYGYVVEGTNIDEVYEVLKRALGKMPRDYPFRGPKELSVGKYNYKNSWKGNSDNYSGQETVSTGKKMVYRANYLGGLVDQRRSS